MNVENDTCWTCSERIGEECIYDGHEVYPHSKICSNYNKSTNIKDI